MMTRRVFLRLLQAGVATGVFGGGWALAEPFWLRVQRYAFTPRDWPKGLRLRLAILTDFHTCTPWMDGARVASIADAAQALDADAILLLGDYVKGPRPSRPIPEKDWAAPLGRLKAPLGVHAVLGNHDWWQDPPAATVRGRLPRAGIALQEAGVRVYHNEAVRLEKDGHAFWLAGLGDQLAQLQIVGDEVPFGFDDLDGVLAQIKTDEPVILMAHEPDIFPDVPERISLTLCGHTHAGQVRLFGYPPVMSTRVARRYDWGHFHEGARHLVVSAGLGCSHLPIRFGAPPEIVMLDLGVAA